MLEFFETPVSDASEQVLVEATKMINRANAVHNRLFPGERLEADDIATEHRDWLLVLGRLDGVLVGTMVCQTHPDKLKVGLLAVAPEAQGKHIGSKMLERADRIAVGLGLTGLFLEAVDRGGLVPYYLRLGFTEDSRERRPIGSWGAPEEFDLVTLSRSF